MPSRPSMPQPGNDPGSSALQADALTTKATMALYCFMYLFMTVGTNQLAFVKFDFQEFPVCLTTYGKLFLLRVFVVTFKCTYVLIVSTDTAFPAQVFHALLLYTAPVIIYSAHFAQVFVLSVT